MNIIIYLPKNRPHTASHYSQHVTDASLVHYCVVSSIDVLGLVGSLDDIATRAGQANREENRCHSNFWGRSSDVAIWE